MTKIEELKEKIKKVDKGMVLYLSGLVISWVIIIIYLIKNG